MRVLVTRPEADAAPIVRALEARGDEAVLEPLLNIVPDPDAVAELTGIQALALSSANGVRALAARTERRDLPVFAVGDATAAEARDAGFAQVASADGDVAALADLIAARLDPDDGAIFHAAARQVAGDLKGHLEASGFTVRRAILYEAVASTSISAPTARVLAEGGVDAALFFSPRTGRTFVRLLAESRLTAACDRIFAVCLSGAVAETVKGLPWRALHIAAQPTQAALLECLAALDEPGG